MTIADDTQARRGIRGPAWRWQYALELSSVRGLSQDVHVDQLVDQAVRFIKGDSLEPDSELNSTNDDRLTGLAKSFWDNPENRQQFIILTLADFPRDEIAERFVIDQNIFEIVERLYFDIRESREASSWINAHVILPEARSGHTELATKYRAAYWGGRCVADSILDEGKSFSFDEVDRIAEVERVLQLKALAAADMPVGNQIEALKFLRIYTDLEGKKAKLEFQKERFRVKSELESTKLELAERRQEFAERREEQKIEEELRHKESRRHQREEHERLERFRESLRKNWISSEKQTRVKRAARSPLAQLSWKSGPTIEPLTARDLVVTNTETGDVAAAGERDHVAA